MPVLNDLALRVDLDGKHHVFAVYQIHDGLRVYHNARMVGHNSNRIPYV